MLTLPPNVISAGETPAFTAATMPEGLRSVHRTPPDTWARIVVLEGALLYRILEPELEVHTLTTDHAGIASPGVAHQVEATGEVRFRLEFYR